MSDVKCASAGPGGAVALEEAVEDADVEVDVELWSPEAEAVAWESDEEGGGEEVLEGGVEEGVGGEELEDPEASAKRALRLCSACGRWVWIPARSARRYTVLARIAVLDASSKVELSSA